MLRAKPRGRPSASASPAPGPSSTPLEDASPSRVRGSTDAHDHAPSSGPRGAATEVRATATQVRAASPTADARSDAAPGTRLRPGASTRSFGRGVRVGRPRVFLAQDAFVRRRAAEAQAGWSDAARAVFRAFEPAPSAEEDARDRRQFRRLVSDLVAAAGAPRPRRAAALRDVFADHPEIIEWVLSRRDLSTLATEADLPRFTAPPHLARAAEIVGSFEQRTFGRHPWIRALIAALGRAPRRGAMELVPDDLLLHLAARLNRALAGLRLGEEATVQRLLEPDVGLDLSHLSEDLRRGLEATLTDYFDALPLHERRRMLLGLLGEAHDASVSNKLGGLLRAAPPGIQKFVQRLGREVRSSALREAFSTLDDRVPPLAFPVVRRTLERSLGRPLEAIFTHIEEAPIGAGTMAQAHRARLRDGREVVVKVLRPGIQRRVRRELEALEAVSPDPRVARVVRNLGASILAETDLVVEAKNLRRAAAAARRRDGVHVVRPIEDPAPTSEVLLMEPAPGLPIDRFTPEALEAVGLERLDFLELKGLALSALLRNMVEAARRPDSPIHADPHPGNLFLELRPGQRPPYRITTVDYGATIRVPPSMPRAVSWIGLGTLLRNRGLVLRGVRALTALPPEGAAELAGPIDRALAAEGGLIDRTLAIMNLVVDAGLDLPREAILFHGARHTLEAQIRRVDEALDTLDPERQRRRFPTAPVYRAAILGALRGCAKNVAGFMLLAAVPFVLARRGGSR